MSFDYFCMKKKNNSESLKGVLCVSKAKITKTLLKLLMGWPNFMLLEQYSTQNA